MRKAENANVGPKFGQKYSETRLFIGRVRLAVVLFGHHVLGSWCWSGIVGLNMFSNPSTLRTPLSLSLKKKGVLGLGVESRLDDNPKNQPKSKSFSSRHVTRGEGNLGYDLGDVVASFVWERSQSKFQRQEIP